MRLTFAFERHSLSSDPSADCGRDFCSDCGAARDFDCDELVVTSTCEQNKQ